MKDFEIWDYLVASFKKNCSSISTDFEPAENKAEQDAQLLRKMLHAGEEDVHVRLWSNERRLIISRSVARKPNAALAMAASRMRGWPVEVRPSGGTTVVHRPGVLNISLLRADRYARTLKHGYDELCGLILSAAAEIGINLEVGCHSGSYCPGAHDIGWGGRKVAGTAGLVRRLHGLHGQLFHASLVVYGDCKMDVEAISAFEEQIGMPIKYHFSNHSSLAEIRRNMPN